MKNNKYLSIITNFGCHYTCPYCIVKNNNLLIPPTTLRGLDKLAETIDKEQIDIVSISGGGDPLHEWELHEDWYNKLFKITGGLPLEMHTSYVLPRGFNYMFTRVVYHLRDVEKIKDVVKVAFNMRIVFVVTEDFTEEKLVKIYKAFKANNDIDELSFRQMVDSNYQTTHYCQKTLELGHSLGAWHYIKQGDYNLYYAENKTSYKYSDFKK